MFGARRVAPEVRAIQATAWGEWAGDSSPSWSGRSVDTNTAMQLLTVHGCVRFISEGISTLPVDVFRKVDADHNEQVAPPRWVEQPTPDLGFIDWASQVLSSLLLDGNAFCRLTRDDRMVLVEVVPLDPAACTVYREKGRKRYRVNGIDVDPFSILHIPALMMPGSDRGLSPVEYARQTIGKGLAVEEFSARFFGQGMNMGGVIEDPGPVDSDKARMMARVWARLHAGNAKAHLPGVLQGGATWKQTSITNEQAQFLQTQQFTAAQIAAFLFLIDPSEFGLSASAGGSITYANIEQRGVRKVQVTYLPWILRLENAISMLLARPRFVKLNVDGLLRGDTKSRFDTYEVASRINTAAVAIGDKPIMVTSEMRELEDMDPLADSDVPEKPAALAVPPAAGNAGQDGAVAAPTDEAKSAPVLSVVRDARRRVELIRDPVTREVVAMEVDDGAA